jgi:hypothetical protein
MLLHDPPTLAIKVLTFRERHALYSLLQDLLRFVESGETAVCYGIR